MENMAFMGTMVHEGSGIGIVIGTGMKTAMGKIADLLQSAETMDNPFTKKIRATWENFHYHGSYFNSTCSCCWRSPRT